MVLTLQYGGPGGRATRRCLCDDSDVTIDNDDATIDDGNATIDDGDASDDANAHTAHGAGQYTLPSILTSSPYCKLTLPSQSSRGPLECV